MRILLLSDYGAPVGGAEVATLLLRDRLRHRGHEVRLLATTARPGDVPSQADHHAFGTTGRGRTLLQVANPWAARRLRQVLAEFRPDVVHVVLFLTQLSPLILPLLRGYPGVCQVVWYRPVCPLGTKTLPDGSPCESPWGIACLRDGCLPPWDWAPLMLQMAMWSRWRDAFAVFVANSESVRRQLAAHGIGPVEVIGHSVRRPPEPGPLDGTPRAVFAGRLVPEKGATVLVRAFARVAAEIPAARLTLAGDGPERAEVERLVRSHGLSDVVELTGFLDQAELDQRLAGAWVQVVPSLWAEPFGLVAPEAMMRGAAVVASRCGGLQEIVEDGRTGVLVPPGDVDALSRALVRLLGDRDRAERLGRAGRSRAEERYGQERYTTRFEALYSRVIDSHERGYRRRGQPRP